jgi:hypothetical protein
MTTTTSHNAIILIRTDPYLTSITYQLLTDAMQVLDIETLLEADADGDNSVDKNEFVLFRLGQMGLIPQALRLRAEQQFDRMDLGMSNVSMSHV